MIMGQGQFMFYPWFIFCSFVSDPNLHLAKLSNLPALGGTGCGMALRSKIINKTKPSINQLYPYIYFINGTVSQLC